MAGKTTKTAKKATKAKTEKKSVASKVPEIGSVSAAMKKLMAPIGPMPKKPKRKLKPGKRTRAHFKRVPPKIIQKPRPAVKPVPQPPPEIDTAKAVAFGMSIVEQMKRRSAAADRKEAKANEKNDIHLSRRPTTRSQGKNTERFQEADLREFRRLLIAAQERAKAGVTAMKANSFNEGDEREADGGDGTNQTLKLQALGQVGNINRVLQQIDEALHRIDEGTYGVCTMCGKLIRKPRLLNQPFVLTCMECQSEMERAKR